MIKFYSKPYTARTKFLVMCIAITTANSFLITKLACFSVILLNIFIFKIPNFSSSFKLSIMSGTISKPLYWFAALAVSFLIMFAIMNGIAKVISIARKELQVFRAIIQTIPVYVMNSFVFFKFSSNLFFHYYNVLKNISANRPFVIWHSNSNISSISNYLSAAPTRISVSMICRKLAIPITKSSFSLKFTWRPSNFFSTIRTIFCYHGIILTWNI